MLIPFGILAATGGGVAGAFELISTTVLASPAASVTFSSLSTSAADYKHLQIRAISRSDVASSYVDTRVKLNGDTTTGNYSTHEFYGAGSGTPASGGAGPYYPPGIAYSSGASAAANAFGAFVIDILDFASTSKNKTLRGLSGVTATSNLVDLRSVGWYSTAAITSIELNTSGNFIAGSRFSLYGLKG